VVAEQYTRSRDRNGVIPDTEQQDRSPPSQVLPAARPDPIQERLRLLALVRRLTPLAGARKRSALPPYLAGESRSTGGPPKWENLSTRGRRTKRPEELPPGVVHLRFRNRTETMKGAEAKRGGFRIGKDTKDITLDGNAVEGFAAKVDDKR